jgi:hypothetical protein
MLKARLVDLGKGKLYFLHYEAAELKITIE